MGIKVLVKSDLEVRTDVQHPIGNDFKVKGLC